MITKENAEIKNNTVHGRYVYVPSLARKLLRMGHKIIDVKPNHEDRERTVHIFDITDKLDEDLQALIAEIKNNRENNTVKDKDDIRFDKNDVLGRCVYIPSLTRKLLRMGYNIIDVKPNHANSKKTVHIFEYTDRLDKDLEQLIAEAQEKRENNKTKTKVNEMIRDTFLDNKE